MRMRMKKKRNLHDELTADNVNISFMDFKYVYLEET